MERQFLILEILGCLMRVNSTADRDQDSVREGSMLQNAV